MLEDVIRAEASGVVPCSSLQLALWYNTLVYQFREERTSITLDHDNSRYQSKEGKTVEKQTVFGIEKSAQRYTPAACN